MSSPPNEGESALHRLVRMAPHVRVVGVKGNNLSHTITAQDLAPATPAVSTTAAAQQGATVAPVPSLFRLLSTLPYLSQLELTEGWDDAAREHFTALTVLSASLTSLSLGRHMDFVPLE